jgi:spermidine/putrescine transport system ATP-binding protein
LSLQIAALHSADSVSDSGITLEGVSKRFGSVEAVRSTSLEIREGEFFSLLGPSGCGKTTTLRMIGGFEQPDEGRVLLRGVDVTAVPPNRRNVNMVFQHYALFPHMSIRDNIAFGMRLKRVDKAEQRERVGEMLRIVRLEGLEKRKPAQLSGGQQQRIALARALYGDPFLVVLAEPNSNLDAEGEEALTKAILGVRARAGIVLIVAHRPSALAAVDRVLVMMRGAQHAFGPKEEILTPTIRREPTTPAPLKIIPRAAG